MLRDWSSRQRVCVLLRRRQRVPSSQQAPGPAAEATDKVPIGLQIRGHMAHMRSRNQLGKVVHTIEEKHKGEDTGRDVQERGPSVSLLGSEQLFTDQ